MEKLLISCLYYYLFCVGAGVSTLMSISDGLASYIFRRKLEKTQPIRERMEGKVFFPPESAIFVFLVNMIKVLFSICTLTWPVNNYVSRQGKGKNRRNESSIIDMVIVYHCTSHIK